MSSCTLQKPYERTGLEPTALIFLCSSTLKVPDDFKYFIYIYFILYILNIFVDMFLTV